MANAVEFEVTTLQGPITVVYRKSGRDCLCTILEFDLVGIGRTRKEAFKEAHAVLVTYIEACLKAPGKVHFFNPSDACDWNLKNKEQYFVRFITARPRHKPSLPTQIPDIDAMREYRDTIQNIQLVPAGAC